MPDRLKTKRLELTPGTLDLVNAELRGQDGLAAGLRAEVPADWPPPEFDEGALRFMLERLEAGREQRGWWLWYLVQRSPRVVVGTGGFKGPPSDGEVEIGYSIARSFQGRGFATEAVEALIAHAFEDERVERVAAETLPDGAASMNVLDKCGFSKVEERDGIVRFVRLRTERGP